MISMFFAISICLMIIAFCGLLVSNNNNKYYYSKEDNEHRQKWSTDKLIDQHDSIKESLAKIRQYVVEEDDYGRSHYYNEIRQYYSKFVNLQNECLKELINKQYDDNSDEIYSDFLDKMARFSVMNERVMELLDSDVILTLMRRDANKIWDNPGKLLGDIKQELMNYSDAMSNIDVDEKIAKVNERFNVTSNHVVDITTVERVFDPRKSKKTVL